MAKTKSTNLVVGLILAAIFIVGGFIAVRTFGTTGPEAIARMDGEDRAVLAKLQSIRRDMLFSEVVAIMGPPDDEGPLEMRPRWNIGGSPLNVAVVYIYPDGAHHFTWISIGRFVYNEQFHS